LVDSREYFDDEDEPTTQPGAKGRTVTPLESERAALGDSSEVATGKTAVIGPPQGAQNAPRVTAGNIPVVTPTPNVQVRPSVFGMPSVGPGADAGTSRPPPGRNPGDGLPRIVRPEGPGSGPPMLSPSSNPSSPPGPPMRPVSQGPGAPIATPGPVPSTRTPPP